MGNIKVLIFVESRYKVNRKRVRETVSKLLENQGVFSPVEVSIAIVGDRKMRSLSRKYKGEDKTRNILSFSQNISTSYALHIIVSLVYKIFNKLKNNLKFINNYLKFNFTYKY